MRRPSLRRPGSSTTPRLTRTVAILLAGALAIAGCSGPGDGDAVTSADGVDATSTLPRSVTGAVDLRRLVVSKAPVGYQLLASPPFGAVDLTRLLEEFSDAPTEDRVILEGAGFERGYTRGWLREDPRSFLGVFVFEFADGEGARSAQIQFAAQNESAKDAVQFAVEGITGAVGESYDQEAEDGSPERVYLVTFVRDARLYQVGGQFADPDATADETVAFAMIEDQIAA